MSDIDSKGVQIIAPEPMRPPPILSVIENPENSLNLLASEVPSGEGGDSVKIRMCRMCNVPYIGHKCPHRKKRKHTEISN